MFFILLSLVCRHLEFDGSRSCLGRERFEILELSRTSSLFLFNMLALFYVILIKVIFRFEINNIWPKMDVGAPRSTRNPAREIWTSGIREVGVARVAVISPWNMLSLRAPYILSHFGVSLNTQSWQKDHSYMTKCSIDKYLHQSLWICHIIVGL